MTDFEKRVDPNATIQIDKIDALELVQLEEAAEARAEEARPSLPVSRRTAPPPLPVSSPPASASPDPAGVPGVAASLAPGARKSTVPPGSSSRLAVYGVVFVVLLAGAIFGGLFAGRLIRGTPPPAQAAAAAPAPPAAAPTGSAAPLNIPEVEISGH